MILNLIKKFWNRKSKKPLDNVTDESYLPIEIGQPSPFNPCDNPDGGVTANVQSGIITCVIHLPDVTDYERYTLANTCIAMGFYAEDFFPTGLMTFVFKGHDNDDSAWPIKTPLIDDPRNVLNWIERSESNIIMFVLVEQKNNIVQQIRIMGLPEDYLNTLKNSWRHYKEFSPQQYNQIITRFSERELWRKSKTWQFEPENEEFVAMG